MNALDLDKVCFSYAGSSKPALDAVSLSVGRGEFVALMGRTGCGKTTLLLTLNGIIPKSIAPIDSRLAGMCRQSRQMNENSKANGMVTATIRAVRTLNRNGRKPMPRQNRVINQRSELIN